jgi:MFS superfamily sulfate permease-like transporter
MLSKEEQQFLDYWSVERTRKRRAGATLGFRLSVLVVFGIFLSIVTGWHKEAMTVLRSDPSTILVIVLAAIAIVVFITIFSSRYQWEQREQRYKELLVKKKADEKKDDQK